MPNIFVNHINFEFEETSSYHDILTNSGSGSQSLSENIVSISRIYVNQIYLEVPVAEVPADTLTCVQHSEQTIEEVIAGTPVLEPEIAVGGGVGQRIRVMGGRPWSEEDVYVLNQATHFLGEEIFVDEIIETYANNKSDIQTKIRRPIYAKPRTVEILSFSPAKEKTIIIPLEETKTNSRHREEEELLLLGII